VAGTKKSQIGGVTITRMFDAPVDRVWKAWSDAKEMRKWWGPKIFTSPVLKMDFREGGSFLHCMRDPDGRDYWDTGIYREIVPKKRIVVTDSFADKNGKIVHAAHYGMSKITRGCRQRYDTVFRII